MTVWGERHMHEKTKQNTTTTQPHCKVSCANRQRRLIGRRWVVWINLDVSGGRIAPVEIILCGRFACLNAFFYGWWRLTATNFGWWFKNDAHTKKWPEFDLELQGSRLCALLVVLPELQRWLQLSVRGYTKPPGAFILLLSRFNDEIE